MYRKAIIGPGLNVNCTGAQMATTLGGGESSRNLLGGHFSKRLFFFFKQSFEVSQVVGMEEYSQRKRLMKQKSTESPM